MTRRQSSGVRHLGTLDIVEVYGHRPKTAEVWWLSPCEFVANWAVTMARVPTTQREWNLVAGRFVDGSRSQIDTKVNRSRQEVATATRDSLLPGCANYAGSNMFRRWNGNSTAPTPLLSATSASPLLPAL